MYTQNCSQTIDGERVTLTGKCIITGKKYSVTVRKSQLKDYQDGALAQDAFPFLSADEREFFISGVSPEGWKHLFPEE